MIDRLFLKFFLFVINIIDQINKKKIIFFFKKNLGEKKINIIDIGAHKGETIDLFVSKLNINKIYSFEPIPPQSKLSMFRNLFSGISQLLFFDVFRK